MKGLLIKDFSVLARQMRVYLLLIIFFAVLPGSNMATFAVVYAAMMPYTTLAYDERSKWNQLASMMPYSKKELILSKYVLGWCFVVGTALIAIASGLVESRFFNRASSPFAVVLAVCAAVIMMDITLPPMFRFGVERGRMFFILVVVILVCGFTGALTYLSQNINPSTLTSTLAWILPVAAVLLTPISISLSLRLYEKHNR